MSAMATPLEPRAAPDAAEAAGAPAQATVRATRFKRIEAAVASARGSRRTLNEDAHSLPADPGCLFVVADGVGGGALAGLASRLLVAHLHATLAGARVDAPAVGDALIGADRAIARHLARMTEHPGAATAALCAPVNPWASRWLVAWVGDCRVYRVGPARRDGAPARVALLTRDDSFRHLDEAPPPGSSADDPARMVGNGAIAQPNVALHALGRGEVLALCSDGVHKHLADDDWRAAIAPPGPAAAPVPLAEACDALVALARARGSTDDATVMLLRRAGLALPHWLARRRAPGPA